MNAMISTILLLGVAMGAFASVESTVKVESFLCDRPTVIRKGSGNLVSYQSKIYVFTTSHGVFHGGKRQNICHRVWNEALGERDAEFLSADFSTDLALLAVTTKKEQSLPVKPLDLNHLAFQKNKQSSERFGTVAGYGYDGRTLERTDQVEILALKSDRAVFSRTKRVIEIEGHIEKGMSGGGFFSKQGDYLGLISHHFFVVAEGKKAQVETLDRIGKQKGRVQNIGVVVPVESVSEWALSVIRREPGASLVEDLSSQLDPRKNISATLAGIRWTPKGKAVFKDGSGVGSGGDEKDRLENEGRPEPAAISLSLSGEVVNESSRFCGQSWYEDIKKRLNARCELQIVGLRYQGKRMPVFDLGTTLSLIEQGYRPLIRIQRSELFPLTQVEKGLLEKSKKATSLVQSAKRLMSSHQDRSCANSIHVLQDIEGWLETIENSQYELVPEAEFAQLLRPDEADSRTEGWTKLAEMLPDLTIELKTLLFAIQADLKKVRL